MLVGAFLLYSGYVDNPFLRISTGGNDLVEEDTFIPPVYETGTTPDVLSSPLLLPVGEREGVLTSGEEKRIEEFKAKVLTRISAQEPLSEKEKTVLEISVSTSESSPIGMLIMANQTVLSFTDAEIELIEVALRK